MATNLEIRIIDNGKVDQIEKTNLEIARQKKTYMIQKEAYTYDENCLLEEQGKRVIYHKRGNPTPILLDLKNAQEKFISSFDAKTILTSNTLREILATEDIKNLKFWLIINLLLIVGIGILNVIVMTRGGTV